VVTSDIVGLPIATLSVAVGVLTNTGLTLELALFFGVRRRDVSSHHSNSS